MENFEEIRLKPQFKFLRILFSSTLIPFDLLFIVGLIILPFLPEVSPVFLLIGVISIGITEFFALKNYKATEYLITEDKINFKEGFVDNKAVSLKIKDIKEFHLTQSYLQRLFGLGTIRILTSGSSELSGGGLKLVDIEKSNYIYVQLNQLAKEAFDKNNVPLEESELFAKHHSDVKTPYLYFMALPIVLPFTVLISAGIFYLCLEYLHMPFNDVISETMGLGFGILVLATYLTRELIRMEFSARSYQIKPTRVEAKEGFFNYNFASIDLRNVREIRLQRSYFQRMFHLGTIIIDTPTKKGYGTQDNQNGLLGIVKWLLFPKSGKKQMSYYSTGIKIVNLKNYAGVYKLLKELIVYSSTGVVHEISKDKPLATYKPTFKIQLQFASLIYPIMILLILSPLCIASSMSPKFAGLALLPFLLAVISLVVPVYLQKKNYDCTKYEIYPTKLEFHEGFIENKSSSMLIKNIREIHVSENFLQRMVKLGTIKIITSGSTDATSINQSGEVFRDIINCRQVYEDLKQLIDDLKKNPSVASKVVVDEVADVNTEIEEDVNIEVEDEDSFTPEENDVNNEEISEEAIQNSEITNPDENIKTDEVVSEQKNENFEKPNVKTMFLKPNLSPLNIFLSIFFKVATFILIIGFAFIVSSDDASKLIGNSTFVAIAFVFGAVVCLVITALMSIVVGLNYSKTNYDLKSDKINYTEGFVNNNYVSIDYENIRELKLEQNFAQRICNLGTISVYTSADNSSSGLFIKDIKNSEETFDVLKNNVKAHMKKATTHNLVKSFKPKFVVLYAILCYVIPASIGLSIFLGLNLQVFILAFIATLVGSIIVHKYTSYSVYSDVIDFSYSFVSKRCTTIFNEKLREIHFNQGFIQKLFNIATFKLITAFSGSHSACMFNVTNIQEVNDLLQDIASKNDD